MVVIESGRGGGGGRLAGRGGGGARGTGQQQAGGETEPARPADATSPTQHKTKSPQTTRKRNSSPQKTWTLARVSILCYSARRVCVFLTGDIVSKRFATSVLFRQADINPCTVLYVSKSNFLVLLKVFLFLFCSFSKQSWTKCFNFGTFWIRARKI